MSGKLNFKLLQHLSTFIGSTARQRPTVLKKCKWNAVTSFSRANYSTYDISAAVNEHSSDGKPGEKISSSAADSELDDVLSLIQKDQPYPEKADTELDIGAPIDVRTAVNKPEEHSVMDKYKFYTVDQQAVEELHLMKILRTEQAEKAQSFHELSLMVRQPCLESLQFVKANAAPLNLATKVLLYGQNGCGKSSAFAHSLHACYSMNWFIVCPVRQYLWNMYFKELTPSAFKEGRIDLPEDGALFLQQLRTTNRVVLEKFGNSMKTHHTYKWSKREGMEEGSTIQSLIEQGIERPKLSNDVIGALFKEIRLYSHEWPTPTLVAIDGVNSIFDKTQIFTDKLKQHTLPVSSVSVMYHLQKLLSSEWRHGAVLVTVCPRANIPERREDYHPRYLLGETGFNALSPFVPVKLDNYTNKEVNNALDYLTEMNWIQVHKYRTSQKARRELMFLSNNNPFYLDRILRTC